MVYFLYNGESVKIGHSKNPKKRVKQLQTGSSSRILLLGSIEGGKELEKELHKKFNYIRIKNEWFLPHEDLVEYINENIIENKYINIEEDGRLTSLLRIR